MKRTGEGREEGGREGKMKQGRRGKESGWGGRAGDHPAK
jgi:hypothetical protein